MAKGLRSKCKRANRAQLRKTLSDPIIKKRVETLHKALEDKLKESRDGISNFDSLKSAFQAASSGGDSAAGDMAIEEEDEDEEEDEEEEGEEFKSKRTIAKEDFIKKKGSKARINPGKQLVWFK
jgi:ribosomal protein L12E/L44/L45/RPP1/RPP2